MSHMLNEVWRRLMSFSIQKEVTVVDTRIGIMKLALQILVLVYVFR